MNHPHDLGAERAILGAVLISPHVVAKAAAAGLERESFYREPHRVCWQAMSEVDNAGALDIVTLSGRLEEMGKMDEIGGFSFLVGLTASTPLVANIGAYVDTVLRHARARDLMVACSETVASVAAGDDADEARASLSARLTTGTATAPTCNAEAGSVNAILDAMRSGKPPAQFLRSPWPLINSAIRGVYRGELTIVVAQPRTGKSVLVDQWATHLAIEGTPGCVFALEMTHEQMSLRRLACIAHADYADLQDYRLRPDHEVAVDAAREVLASSPLMTDDAMLSMEQIWARTKAGVRQHGWEWIVIDHAHIVRASDPKANRIDQLGHIGLLGKQIAKDTGVAVLMAAQMNSDLKRRTDKRPRLGDIAYGTTMEQSAATILGLYRDELVDEDTNFRGLADVIPVKTRFGAGVPVQLRWVGEQQRFNSTLDGGFE